MESKGKRKRRTKLLNQISKHEQKSENKRQKNQGRKRREGRRKTNEKWKMYIKDIGSINGGMGSLSSSALI